LFIFTKNNIRFLSDAGFILLLYFTYCWLTWVFDSSRN
jgi:hypothetical protein